MLDFFEVEGRLGNENMLFVSSSEGLLFVDVIVLGKVNKDGACVFSVGSWCSLAWPNKLLLPDSEELFLNRSNMLAPVGFELN